MITKNRIKTVLTAMAIVAIAATPALADLAPGVTLNFDASDPASGVGGNWNSLTTVTDRNWTFGADVTLEDVSTLHKITKSYRFTGVTGASASSWHGFNENANATWEFWIKPADTGDDNQVIFETGGGGDGMAFWYVKGTDSDNSGTFNFTIDDGGAQATVSAVIDTTDFHNIVAVYEKDTGGIDLMQVYVDGVLVDDNDASTTFDDTTDTNTNDLNDWAGSDGATLGSNGGLADTVLAGQYEGDIPVLRFWEAKALTAAEVEDNFKVLGVLDPLEPSPADGDMVLPGDVELSWTNLAPVTPGGPVYVNVWFGTDPNDTTGVNFTRVVTADIDGENRTSVTVFAPLLEEPSPTPYYWQVTSYINGSPTSDPNQGRLYTFYAADLPPSSVDAGVDMITWAGQPVDLDPTIEDDGVSPLAYLWTADPALGVAFDSDSIANPIVTITGRSVSREVQAETDDGEQYINSEANSGRVQGEMKFLTDTDLELGSETDGDSPGLDWQVIAVQYHTLGIPQGSTITSAKITFEVQNSGEPGTSNDFTILAEAADDASVFDENVLNNITDRARSAASVAWAPDALPAVGTRVETPDITTLIQEVVDRAGWSDNNRLTLMIYPDVYLASPTGGTTTVQEIEFEGGPGPDAPTLRVTYDPPAGSPPLSVPSTFTLTLAVTDGANETPVEDTMTIDVYDDACQMAVALDPAVIEVTDFNADCTTNLKDFAILAVKWLGDYSLTEPVPLP